ncbi:MAG TPA: CRISPR system precrRNA processing endoribonuclease RAMP protein Cas6 [Blastocatellia bacterium]|nr:CRISPR system precrRNA processing endoribonuclease RAMP protein Cas6 [Blastocatellia bacterium]
MRPEDFAALDLSRYELRLRAFGAVGLPHYLGSTLRGAFGRALKDAVCVMAHRNCERCLVADRCGYPYIFETPPPSDISLLRGQQRAPHPFILTPPIPQFVPSQASHKAKATPQPGSAIQLADGRAVRLVQSSGLATSEERRMLKTGDALTFELLLMGRASEFMPYVVYAVSEMARHGLGAERGRFELSDVALIDEQGAALEVYSEKTQRLTVPGQATKCLSDLISRRLEQLAAAPFSADTIGLRFVTPARIRVEGDLQVGLSFDLLVRNLLRRVSLLAVVHGRAPLDVDYRALLDLAGGVKTSCSAVRWWDWERYSNRQKTKVSLGGFIGEVYFEGEALRDFLPLLVAGEILHIGTGTSFGLGKYRIVMPHGEPSKTMADSLT